MSAPGLGIVPDPDDGTGLLRYSVVHLGSGLAVFGCVTSRCATHTQRAIALMALSGIDWTQPAALLTEQPIRPTWQFLLDSYEPRFDPEATQIGALRRFLLDALPLCFDPETAKAVRCLGDPPAGAAARQAAEVAR
jgi:hypothetical protein